MPAIFMEEYKQALALERITAEPKKQLVILQTVDVQVTEKSLHIELAAVQANI
jgi:hypothetical protein